MTSQPWPCTRAQQLCRALFGDLFGATGCATALSRATAPFTATFPRGGARAHPLHLELLWSSQLSSTPGSSAFPGMSQPHLGISRSSCGQRAQQCQGVSACLGTASHGKPFPGEEFKGSCWNAQPGAGLGHAQGAVPAPGVPLGPCSQ